MRDTEKQFLNILDKAGVDLLCTLPCDRVKRVIELAGSKEHGWKFRHLPLIREEEGVGICAGVTLAGKRPTMLIQNSGVGNMINALLSLTRFYELPLPIFLSHRGVYKEGIPAQVPMGEAIPGLLEAMGISYTSIDSDEQFEEMGSKLSEVYEGNKVHAFLLSPKVWEDSSGTGAKESDLCPCSFTPSKDLSDVDTTPLMKRFEIIEAIKEKLKGEIVICNIGLPSKELYELLDQPTNFYMLGSMGMATPIGLGVAMFTDKRVYVIDGDGSLLMNPGTLATVSSAMAQNLTILAIDNSSYGSTGCQPTLTGTCVDLEQVAKGFGISNTFKTSSADGILSAMNAETQAPKFIHIPAISGNASVKNVPIGKLEIRDRFSQSLS